MSPSIDYSKFADLYDYSREEYREETSPYMIWVLSK